MVKKELTITEFRAIIKEEALKLKKRIVLENEKKALIKELEEYGIVCNKEEELGEGVWDSVKSAVGIKTPEEKAKILKQSFIDRSKQWKKALDQPLLDILMKQAAEDNYNGRAAHKDGKMSYYPSTAKELGMTSKGTSSFGE